MLKQRKQENWRKQKAGIRILTVPGLFQILIPFKGECILWQLPKGQVRPSEGPQAVIVAEQCDQDGLGDRALRQEYSRVGVSAAAWDRHISDVALICLGKAYGKVPNLFFTHSKFWLEMNFNRIKEQIPIFFKFAS